MRSSTDTANTHQDLKCCAFWDAFLLTMDVRSGYLSYLILPVTSNQSGRLHLAFYINKAFSL